MGVLADAVGKRPLVRPQGRLVVHWPRLAAWMVGFVALRLLLGGYVAPVASPPGAVGSATPVSTGSLSFVWIPTPHTYVLVWWPSWLGFLALGLLLGAALGVRREGCPCGLARWTARGGGFLAILSGLGCCGLALPGAVFGGLAALSPFVGLADAALVAGSIWTLHRTLAGPRPVPEPGARRFASHWPR